MLSYINGELTEVFEDTIVLENNGIGYNIRVPASLFSQIPSIGEMVKIYTYLYVKEDAMNLFGFLNRDDLEVFKMLLNVSGIGPKGALAILSTMTPDELRFAVLADDVKLIKSAPGIGAKTAQRLILELKDKLKLEDTFEKALANSQKAAIDDSSKNKDFTARNDAIAALVALGYSNSEALKAVKQVEDAENKDVDVILKEALKKMI